jgi:formyltetrahydrofolate deformylase
MQVTITAVGPDNVGLADPIVHYVTGAGANIHEIQMYDHDSHALFAMLMRIEWSPESKSVATLRERLQQIGRQKGLSIRVWSRDERSGRQPCLAICATYRPEPVLAILRGIQDGHLLADAAVMLANRDACEAVARQHGVDFQMIGDASGQPDNSRMEQLIDQYDVDYIVLARYMRVLPPDLCWKFAGGRIINLHHGLLPSFPGFHPYQDAYSHHMLNYGATAHFIIPELDAGDQIINQRTFSVEPGTPLEAIQRQGETENEPACLVEGLRRVVDREVELHFSKVVRVRS